MTSQGVDRVEVEWATAREANLANWEDRVDLHREGYDLDAFRDDPSHLSTVVATDLPVIEAHRASRSLAGARLCHLQCHIGTDTVSLARAGATVTGVDFSPKALAQAAAFAAELDIDATWVHSDVLEARAGIDTALGAESLFDVVYTSIGTVGWLHDVNQWARQVAALLEPGGLFFFRDGHPALFTLDETSDALTVRYRYFGDGTALQWDEETSYAGEGTVAHPRTYEWPHSVSSILQAILDAGLVIEAVDEGRTLPWQFAPRMIQRPDGDFEWPGQERDLVPCTLTVVARKPA